MIFYRILFFLALVLIACSSGQHNKPTLNSNKVLQDTSHYMDDDSILIPYLNKKHLVKNGSYYEMVRFNDSTFKITWGNDSLKRTYDDPLHLMFVERLNVKWQNQDYIILDYNTGSGAWVNVVLPLNKREQVQQFDNGLYFEGKSNYFITSGYEDTILCVYNPKTQKMQSIVDKELPCEFPQKYNCIDQIRIQDKILYYKWAYSDSDKKRLLNIQKRIRLKI